MSAQVAVGETAGQQPKDAEGGEQGLHAGGSAASPAVRVPARGDDRAGEGGQGGGAFGEVVADPLDAEQAPAG